MKSVKAVELIIALILLILSFFAGVKYSESVRSHASWIFEQKEEEVALPDLSNESIIESETITVEEITPQDSISPNNSDAEPITKEVVE